MWHPAFVTVETRQKLGYWFFWFVFLASIPLSLALSIRAWEWGLGWMAVLRPFLLPAGLLHLVLGIKRHQLHERTRLSSPPASSGAKQPPVPF